MPITKKHRLIVSLIALLALCYLPAVAQTTEPAAEKSPLEITAGPYLQAPSETGVTIIWATNRKCVSKVEYGTAPDGPTMTAVSSRHGLIDANTTLHRVRLADLKPGASYYYRAVSTEMLDFQPYKVVYGDTIKSRDERFATLDAGKDRFSSVVLNDRHEKIGPLTQALKSISFDGVDLVFFNGDMFNFVVSDEQIFRSVIRPAQDVFAGRILFVMVRGNHEARGSLARTLMDYFPTANDRFYYSFTHGGVHFVILDSGEDKADSDKEYAGLVRFDPYLEEETVWLKDEVGSEAFKNARFRVVLVHIPPMTNKEDRFSRSKFLQDHWGTLLNDGKIDLMFCGHTHRYAEIQPAEGKNQFPILINGTDTTVRVDASADQLSVSTFNNDGSPKSKLPVITKK